MDSPYLQQNPKFCIKHNQPIILYDKQKNQHLCVLCVQEKTGMVSIDQIQQEQQEIKQKSDKEFQQKQQQLQTLLDSILKYKQNIINGIDKIIQIIIDQIDNLRLTNEKFQKQLIQSNQFNALEQLNIQLKQFKENHEQVKSQIKQLLSDFQQKFINVDYLSKLLTEPSQIIEKKASIDSKSENIQAQERNQEIMQNSKLFQYELLKEPRLKERSVCNSFAFNKDNSILLVGCGSKIKIYQFINGKIGKELQVLSNHTGSVHCLYFMKQSDSFVSGSKDKSIIIWKHEGKNQWVPQQKLTDHQHSLNCLLMNKNEDLLISGSYDETVKFWKKNNDLWSCQQTIKTNNLIYALSLNEMENKLITCGSKARVYIMEIQGDQQWSIKQKIDVVQYGYSLSFTLRDQFVFQLGTKDYLEVYNYDSCLNQFKKQSQVQVQSCEICDILFPCQFLRLLNILLVKHGKSLNLFQVYENKNYKLIQTIQYKDFQLYGSVSDDGQYLVTWDNGSQEIQVRKLKQINQ